MMKIYKYKNLGEMKIDWLHARYHFSFSNYYNPDRMGFGPLRVINDDIVKAGSGFPPHGHKNMEIITYVRAGEILHGDNMGNSGSTQAGDVQVMSAGSGIAHSEFSSKTVDTNLYQIWIEPNVENVKPRWETKTFPKDFVTDELPVLVSGREADKQKSSLFIYQDAAIYAGRIKAGTEITQKISDMAYILASSGRFTANEEELEKGDGAEVTAEKFLKLKAIDDAEILIIDVGNIN